MRLSSLSIRPSSADDELKILAFENESSIKYIIINPSYATKTVSLGRAGEGELYVTDNLLNLEKSVVQLNDINIYPESINTLIVNK